MRENEEPKVSRRAFIKTGCTLLVGTAALGVTGCGLFDSPELRLGRLADLRKTGPWTREFNGDAIYIALNADGEPYCLSLICTHKQCTVGWNKREGRFKCPCHGGRFGKAGTPEKGPPQKPLRRFQLENRNGVLWVLNKVLTPS